MGKKILLSLIMALLALCTSAALGESTDGHKTIRTYLNATGSGMTVLKGPSKIGELHHGEGDLFSCKPGNGELLSNGATLTSSDEYNTEPGCSDVNHEQTCTFLSWPLRVTTILGNTYVWDTFAFGTMGETITIGDNESGDDHPAVAIQPVPPTLLLFPAGIHYRRKTGGRYDGADNSIGCEIHRIWLVDRFLGIWKNQTHNYTLYTACPNYGTFYFWMLDGQNNLKYFGSYLPENLSKNFYTYPNTTSNEAIPNASFFRISDLQSGGTKSLTTCKIEAPGLWNGPLCNELDRTIKITSTLDNFDYNFVYERAYMDVPSGGTPGFSDAQYFDKASGCLNGVFNPKPGSVGSGFSLYSITAKYVVYQMNSSADANSQLSLGIGELYLDGAIFKLKLYWAYDMDSPINVGETVFTVNNTSDGLYSLTADEKTAGSPFAGASQWVPQADMPPVLTWNELAAFAINVSGAVATWDAAPVLNAVGNTLELLNGSWPKLIGTPQPVPANGSGGNARYSKWKFTISGDPDAYAYYNIFMTQDQANKMPKILNVVLSYVPKGSEFMGIAASWNQPKMFDMAFEYPILYTAKSPGELVGIWHDKASGNPVYISNPRDNNIEIDPGETRHTWGPITPIAFYMGSFPRSELRGSPLRWCASADRHLKQDAITYNIMKNVNGKLFLLQTNCDLSEVPDAEGKYNNKAAKDWWKSARMLTKD